MNLLQLLKLPHSGSKHTSVCLCQDHDSPSRTLRFLRTLSSWAARTTSGLSLRVLTPLATSACHPESASPNASREDWSPKNSSCSSTCDRWVQLESVPNCPRRALFLLQRASDAQQSAPKTCTIQRSGLRTPYCSGWPFQCVLHPK